MPGAYWFASYPGSGGEEIFHLLRALLIEYGDFDGSFPAATWPPHSGLRYWLDEFSGIDTAELTADEAGQLRPQVHRWLGECPKSQLHFIYDAYTFVPNGEPLVGEKGTRGSLYLIRDPRAVASAIAHERRISFEDAVSLLSDASQPHGAHDPGQVTQKLLSWSEHVRSWTEAPGLGCSVIWYEDFLRRPLKVLADAARSVGLEVDDEKIAAILKDQEASMSAIQSGRNRLENQQGTALLSLELRRRVFEEHGSTMRRFGYDDSSSGWLADQHGDRGAAPPSNPGSTMLAGGTICIRTTRFDVRTLEPSDVTESYVQWWNDERIQAGLNRTPRNWDRLRAENFVRSHDNQRKLHLGVFEKEGKLIGFCGIQILQKGELAEISFVIGDGTYRRQSVPDETFPRIFDWLFTHTAVVKIKAYVLDQNLASRAMVGRVGFVLEGILRQEWRGAAGGRVDVHVFSVLRREWLRQESV